MATPYERLLDAATKVLNHVEDMGAERVGNQCTLCYSYRKILEDAIIMAASELGIPDEG